MLCETGKNALKRVFPIGFGYSGGLEDERAQIVFIDAPYNVSIDGHVSGKGKVCHSGTSWRLSFDAHHCVWQVMMAHWADDEVDRFLANQQFHARTSRNIVDPVHLRAELIQIRRQGFALDDEEHSQG